MKLLDLLATPQPVAGPEDQPPQQRTRRAWLCGLWLAPGTGALLVADTRSDALALWMPSCRGAQPWDPVQRFKHRLGGLTVLLLC